MIEIIDNPLWIRDINLLKMGLRETADIILCWSGAFKDNNFMSKLNQAHQEYDRSK